MRGLDSQVSIRFDNTCDERPLPETVRTERHDVVFAFFGVSWAASVRRNKIFSEDRLADTLLNHPRVRRLIVAEPYRSVAGRVRGALRRPRPPRFPATTDRILYSPLRIRRWDPIEPTSAVARYEEGLRRLAARHGLERPAIITTHPLLAGFGDFEWAGRVTYYGFDDWTASRPHERWWRTYEAAFARMRASRRAVVAVSDGILERIQPTGPHAVVPNGVEPTEWLEPAPAPAWCMTLPHPRCTYIGSLDSRVDVAALDSVAAAFPHGSLVVVGPMLDASHFAPLRARTNVTIRPTLDRTDVAGLLRASDVCVIPHLRNDLTRSMSPLKLFEYLAAGRPVAAVDLPPIAAVASKRVVLVSEGEDFTAAVSRALALGPAPEVERRAFIAANTWECRFERLLDVALTS
jgi:teichuronic acid biosynthesis glycosyltransferase TuaH